MATTAPDIRSPSALSRLIGVAIFLSVAFFTSIVDLTLGRAGLMPVQPTYLAIVIVGALTALVFMEAVRRRTVWRQLSRTVVASAPQLIFYGAIAAFSLLGAALPGAYWLDEGKWILLIPYGFFVWFGTLLISSHEVLRPPARSGIMLGFLLLSGSVIYEIFFPASFSNLDARASGFAGNSNFGALATCMLCAAVLGYGDAKSRKRDLVFLSLTAVAVLATQSRSGLVEFAVVFLCWAWSCVTDPSFSVREALRFVALSVITLVVVGVVFSFVLQNSVLFSGEGNRFARILSGKSIDDGSGDERVRAALDAFRLISEKPVIGHGTGHTRTMHVLPHNQYLQQWVNNGLIGLLAYGMLLVTALVTFLRRRYIPGVCFVCVTLIGSVFSHNVLDQRSFIMTFAILLASSVAPRSTAENEAQSSYGN